MHGTTRARPSTRRSRGSAHSATRTASSRSPRAGQRHAGRSGTRRSARRVKDIGKTDGRGRAHVCASTNAASRDRHVERRSSWTVGGRGAYRLRRRGRPGGGIGHQGCTFARPVPVMDVHGTAEPFVNIRAGSDRRRSTARAERQGKTIGGRAHCRTSPGSVDPQIAAGLGEAQRLRHHANRLRRSRATSRRSRPARPAPRSARAASRGRPACPRSISVGGACRRRRQDDHDISANQLSGRSSARTRSRLGARRRHGRAPGHKKRFRYEANA